METGDTCAQFIRKLREETKIYNNFPGILEKVERDGHLQAIYSTMSGIFTSEMVFAITRGLKRAAAHEDQKYEDRHQEAPRDQFIHLQGKSQDNPDVVALAN
jgi:hypothetical protein